MAKLKSPTKVITNEVRASYAHVFTPQADDNGNEKYSVALLIDKNDTETIELIEKAYQNALEEGKATKFGGKIPPVLLKGSILRDGDDERPDDDAYAGKYWINVRSNSKPQVVKNVGGRMVEITDEDEFYSGAFCKASINLFAYNHPSGGKGVSAGLNNIFKTKDGERLAGSADASSDFDDEFEDSAQDFLD